MIISLLAAMDRRRGIGINNQLPWRLSADLKKFRELTMGHHIIVGRKTYQSIGKPLPGRHTIVVTRDSDFRAEGCFVCHGVEEAVALAEQRGESEVFVCGGAEIYAHTLLSADKLYLTLVDAEVAADTYFPEFDENEWIEQERVFHPADEKNQFPFTFKVLIRSADVPSALQTNLGASGDHAVKQ